MLTKINKIMKDKEKLAEVIENPDFSASELVPPTLMETEVREEDADKGNNC